MQISNQLEELKFNENQKKSKILKELDDVKLKEMNDAQYVQMLEANFKREIQYLTEEKELIEQKC